MKTQTAGQTKQSRVNPLAEIKNDPQRARRMEFKVGNLFYDYISNTSLMDREDRITGSDVAEVLEEAGFLKTKLRNRFGKAEKVYSWVKTPPTKAEFLRDILGLNSANN